MTCSYCWASALKKMYCRLTAFLKGFMWKKKNHIAHSFFIIIFFNFFPPIESFMWGWTSSQASPEGPDLWSYSVPTSYSSTFTPPKAVCTSSLTPAELTSHIGYHSQCVWLRPLHAPANSSHSDWSTQRRGGSQDVISRSCWYRETHRVWVKGIKMVEVLVVRRTGVVK